MTKRQTRFFLIISLVLTFLVLYASFYLEYAKGLEPCPLCLMQRLCVIILFLLLVIHSAKIYISRLISGLQLFFSCAGLFFSFRQLWLQSLPASKVPACMPGLDTLIQYFPWKTVVHALLWGAGDCAEVQFRIMGLSLPAWSAGYFLFMGLIALVFLLAAKNK